jgi:hypothetical protein
MIQAKSGCIGKRYQVIASFDEIGSVMSDSRTFLFNICGFINCG